MAETPREEYERCVRVAANLARIKDGVENAGLSWRFAAQALQKEEDPANIIDILDAYSKAAATFDMGGTFLSGAKEETLQEMGSFILKELSRCAKYFGGDREKRLEFIGKIITFLEERGLDEFKPHAMLGGVFLKYEDAMSKMKKGDKLESVLDDFNSAVDMGIITLGASDSATFREAVQSNMSRIELGMITCLNSYIGRDNADMENIIRCLNLISQCIENEGIEKLRSDYFKAALEPFEQTWKLLSGVRGRPHEEAMIDIEKAIDSLSSALETIEKTENQTLIEAFRLACTVLEARIEEELKRQ